MQIEARIPPIVSFLFFTAILALGLYVGQMMLLPPIRDTLHAADWRSVPCTIVASHAHQDVSGAGGRRTPGARHADVTYSYVVDGRTYHGSRFSFFDDAGTSYAKMQRVSGLREGSQSHCFVNPERPGEAVLDRSFQPSELLVGIIPLFIALIGGGGMWYAIPRRRPS